MLLSSIVINVDQSTEDLQNHFREQLTFLERSADAYDEGFVDEAKRLAVTIRVLVHDTKASKSLLRQLGLKTLEFYDTAVEDDVGNLLAYAGLLQMVLNPTGALYIPYLDDPLPHGSAKCSSFDKWWIRSVFMNQERQSLSRKDVVLSVADQDGGAHVDPSLNEVYAKLSRYNSMGWVFQNEYYRYPVRPPELAAVRQIAHEVLKTLAPPFEKHPRVPDNSIIMASPSMRLMTEEEVARFEAENPNAKKLTPQRP